MANELRDSNPAFTTDPFAEGMEAHLDAMLAGTRRYFEAIGSEINTEELRQLMINRPTPRQSSATLEHPISLPSSRNSRVGPVRRSTPPPFHTFGPYQFPSFGVPLPVPPLVSPTGLEHFDAVLPFGPFSSLRDTRLQAIPEDVPHHGELYSIDELCAIFDGEQEYNKEDPCTICQDVLGEVSADVRHVELLCRHRYHTSCLRSWLQEKRNCPTCRMNVIIE